MDQLYYIGIIVAGMAALLSPPALAVLLLAMMSSYFVIAMSHAMADLGLMPERISG